MTQVFQLYGRLTRRLRDDEENVKYQIFQLYGRLTAPLMAGAGG